MDPKNTYLQVPFLEKDQVKCLGARWDNNLKKWYVPNGLNLNNFSKWLTPSAIKDQAIEGNNITFTTDENLEDNLLNNHLASINKGITLSQLLQKISLAIQKIQPELEWIKAEISEISVHKTTGHCYLELVETNNGELLSKVKAIINKNNYLNLSENFKNITGDLLKPGIQILVLVKINFSIQYGLSLYIKDLDPSYTLGDLYAKLAKIRLTLQQEGIYNQNKQLPMPYDFTKIAVLSPNAAAGLGDFNKEAFLLSKHNLCNFYYYTAQFQGKEASMEISNALNKIFLDHQKQNFQALVIIRGGGALIDLAWLNDYEIAKLVCQSPIIVFSGIGHEKDNTIIDEIAGCRFDTPSKVIAHIFNTIARNAQQIEISFKEIKNISYNVYIYNYNQTLSKLNQIIKLSELITLETTQKLQQEYYYILHNIFNCSKIINNSLKEYYIKIQEYILIIVNNLQDKLQEYHKDIPLVMINLYYNLNIKTRELLSKIIDEIQKNYQVNYKLIYAIIKEIYNQFEKIHQQKLEQLQELITSIISLGPKAILSRGYAIIRNCKNEVLKSKQQAKNNKILQIEFHDGMINAKYIGE